MSRAALALGLVCAAAPARADGYLHELAHQAEARLDAALAARPVPRAVPAPLALRWKPQKLGAVEIGGALVALVGADLDGDGKAELYAVTPREVVVLVPRDRGGGLRELGRAAFVGEAAVPAPRDPVGAAAVEREVVVAAASPWRHGLRVQLRDHRVVASEDPTPGFPMCGQRAAIVPGRDYFTSGGAELYALRCRELLDAAGQPVHASAQLALSGRLAVALEGAAPARHEYAGVGTAFEIADLDRDGTPELITSGAGAPGDPDAIKVVALGGDEKKPLFRKAFTGGVAGVVAVDLDGDGALEVVVAVRLLGSTKVDLWRLN